MEGTEMVGLQKGTKENKAVCLDELMAHKITLRRPGDRDYGGHGTKIHESRS